MKSVAAYLFGFDGTNWIPANISANAFTTATVAFDMANPTAIKVLGFNMLYDIGSNDWDPAVGQPNNADGEAVLTEGCTAATSAYLKAFDGTTYARLRTGGTDADAIAGAAATTSGALRVLPFNYFYNQSQASWYRSSGANNNSDGIGVTPAQYGISFPTGYVESSSAHNMMRANSGSQGNAWSGATGAGGTSTAIDTKNCAQVAVFGNLSGATTITIQYSQDNSNFYDSASTIVTAGASDIGQTFAIGARYVRLKSSNNVNAVICVAGKQ